MRCEMDATAEAASISNVDVLGMLLHQLDVLPMPQAS